jgi:hypothetical protein
MNEQVRLYEAGAVNAIAVEWYKVPGGEVSADGPLLVGSDYVSGADANEWDGYVSDPSIFPGIVDALQASNLSVTGDVN